VAHDGIRFSTAGIIHEPITTGAIEGAWNIVTLRISVAVVCLIGAFVIIVTGKAVAMIPEIAGTREGAASSLTLKG